MLSYTKLPNRNSFKEILIDCCDPWLFLIKLDNIETINTFYGEQNRIAVEQEFANYLQEHKHEFLFTTAKLYHLSIGVFGVLVQDTLSEEDALERCKNIFSKTNGHYISLPDFQYTVDTTVVALSGYEKLLENSVLALSEAAKRHVSYLVANDVVKEAFATISNNIMWLRKVRDAVIQNRVVPLFQPIVDNNSGKVFKYEALMRIQSHDEGLIAPGHFLEMAKKSKYYKDLSKMVIAKAIKLFLHRRDQLSINISVLDIEDCDVRMLLFDFLKTYPDLAQRLTLELVEQEGMNYYAKVATFIQEVKRYGVKIAIDDFGSGYSNFRRLFELDVDIIKIDGSLIRNIVHDVIAQDVVEVITQLAQKSRLRVVAEYVEDESVYTYIKKMGIDYSQGFYFGKPQELV